MLIASDNLFLYFTGKPYGFKIISLWEKKNISKKNWCSKHKWSLPFWTGYIWMEIIPKQ